MFRHCTAPLSILAAGVLAAQVPEKVDFKRDVQPISPQPGKKTKAASSPREAFERSIPLLQRTDIAFVQKSGCVSCHNNSLFGMTAGAARRNRLSVDETLVSRQTKRIGTYFDDWRERVLQGIGIPGEITARVMRAIQAYAPKAQRLEYEKAVRLAAAWLAKTKPQTVQDRTFQILALTWAAGPKDVIREGARGLLSLQRMDVSTGNTIPVGHAA